MPLNPNIILSGRVPQLPDPLEAYGKEMGVRNSLMQYQAAQQAAAQQNAMNQYLQNTDLNSPEGRNGLVKFGKAGLEVGKGLDERRKAALDYEKALGDEVKRTATFIYANPQSGKQALMDYARRTGDDITEELAETEGLDAAGWKQWAAGYAFDADDMKPDVKEIDTGGEKIVQAFDMNAAPVGQGTRYQKTADPSNASRAGDSSYSTPVQTSRGLGRFNNRTGAFELITGPEGQVYLPPAVDAAVQGGVAASKASGTAQGKAQGEAVAGLPNALQKADQGINVIDQLIAAPGRETMTGTSGMIDPRNYVGGTKAKDARALHDQVAGQAFLEAFESLKGGGQITEVEGNKATQAMARLDRAQTDEEYKKALIELKGILQTGKSRAVKRAAPSAPAAASSSNVVDWNDLP